MSEPENIFTEMGDVSFENDPFQKGGSDYLNPSEFRKLVEARRSVRKFTKEVIPDEVVNDCLDLALLAPNSSNLQTWEFIRVKTPSIKEKVAYACFSQSAAMTASELIICVARTDNWRAHSKQMLEEFKKLPVATPKVALTYYGKLVPLVYTVGFLNCLTPFKWLMNTIGGFFSVVPRDPISSFGIRTWASKSCALACENLMLAFRAHGFDTCPMEGFDSWKVKSAIGLRGQADIVMIIAAGKRDNGGIYGPRLRFNKEQFLRNV